MADCIEQMKYCVLDEELMHDLESIHDLCASYAGCHTGMVEGAFSELETILDSVIFNIKQRATENVRPVEYGEWIVKPDFMMDVSNECSICGKEFVLLDGTAAIGEYHYCPNCGAKMSEWEIQSNKEKPILIKFENEAIIVNKEGPEELPMESKNEDICN